MKSLLVVYAMFIFICPLMGQTNELNYGYKLSPKAEGAPWSNYARPQAKLHKTTEVGVVDYKGLMPPVLDQGQQGSCSAFSRAYALAYLNNKKYGYSLSHQYSQSFIYNLAAGYVFGGLDMGSCYDVLSEAGYVRDSIFPYNPYDDMTLPSFSIRREAINNRIANWSWFYVGDTLPPLGEGGNPVPVVGYTGINRAKELLAAGQPVILDFDLTGGYGGLMEAENWIYSYAAFGQMPVTGGHSLCLVGYNDTAMTKDGPGYFVAINSWGAGKFDKGYCKITYKILALTNYTGTFSTFNIRDGYRPQLTATFDLSNFGCFFYINAKLKSSNGVIRQRFIWRYRLGVPSQHFVDQSMVDLTEFAEGLNLEGKTSLILDGIFYPSKFGPNKPMIRGLRITDSTRGIDVYQSCNIIIKDSIFHAEWSFDKSALTITDVPDRDPVIPTSSALSQNYPNPFNPSTTIEFTLSKRGATTLKVYDVVGREVAVLINKEVLEAGQHQARFNGAGLSSGLYIYQLTTTDFKCTKKMILQK